MAIVVFRYLMVCHAVWCQNLGGERPLWRIVSFSRIFKVKLTVQKNQIWACMLFLCLGSGSLIFFTMDISLTFLLCIGSEERFRYVAAVKEKELKLLNILTF